MHIPDGYLSPATAATTIAAAAPFWYHGSKRIKTLLRSESAPLVALFSAFCFTVQMFNFPLPGGTTAHAVGGTLVAVVLGPWPAVIAVSTSLIIQALFFGDGGITAIGANSLNMAVALPFVGYSVYRILAGRAPSPRRLTIAAAAGAYAGVNAAALLTGLELGIQPIFWSEGGRALYCPYGLDVTIPALMISHLTIAGFAEAALTALTISYLMKAHPDVIDASVRQVVGLGRVGKGLVIGLVLLVVLTPVGLLAPGSADFESSAGEISSGLGYAPSGLARLEGLWAAPFSGYGLSAESNSFLADAQGYLLSAILGIALIFAVVFAARIFLARRVSAVE